MNFHYVGLPGISKRPLVEVVLKYKNRILDYPVICLIDSGADFSYLSLQIAHDLGINLSKIKPQHSFGITGEPFSAYPVSIIGEIGGWEFSLVAHFSDDLGDGVCVLGQEGLFDQARICFERYKWNLDIRPRDSVN